MADYDLTPRMIPYLDRHLVFPLLEFLQLNEIYPAKDLYKAKYDLLAKTNMVDFIADLHKGINETEETPEEFTRKREEVLQTLQEFQSEAQKVLDIIENPEVLANLRQDKLQNLHYLEKNFGLTEEMANTLYQLAQFQYNCGNYGGASDMLYHFRILSTDNELNLSALWGKLASDILDVNWEAALEELQRLRETIDSRPVVSPLHQLQQRTWFIHWSIFVFFNHPKGRDDIIDLFLQTQYINTIQTSCPWILRYLTTAVVTNKRRKNILKDLIKIIQQESYEYRDPITEFIESLYIKFDFEGAQKKLKECEEVLRSDFFLVATKNDFIENARYLISETYCRIHLKIDISGLSKTLNLSPEAGEKWIVNLIRDTRVDAKIDFKENTVVMNKIHTPICQQVIERTRGLSFRSQVLASTIEKHEAQNAAALAETVVE
ncbi:6837_t:CDS:2 [Paraglomus brasilianum]|uniref:Eukaryotic translation initiation factor 3 subunit E n=1 Tax=Paraglomus brasilianum TaxID=144538 RepID=A0A9N9BQK8_9GLOM|nr:6837_t:CDS:2 [Paraglomus brasilianum]